MIINWNRLATYWSQNYFNKTAMIFDFIVNVSEFLVFLLHFQVDSIFTFIFSLPLHDIPLSAI